MGREGPGHSPEVAKVGRGEGQMTLPPLPHTSLFLLPLFFHSSSLYSSDSFAIHSDDGKVFAHGGARQLTAPFGPGDTIGVGIDVPTMAIFYTRNGQFLGTYLVLLQALSSSGPGER